MAAIMSLGQHRTEDGVKPEFQPGVSDQLTITTTKEMGITHLGPSVPSMYSTPSMVQLIEGTCVQLMSRYVDAGEQSVGFHVDVRHLAPTPIGKKVTASVTLREVNGRRYKFDVEVSNEDGVKIGEGIHERALIDIARFASSAQS
jgi:predicted thioesterase